jgi:hypothetical protein
MTKRKFEQIGREFAKAMDQALSAGFRLEMDQGMALIDEAAGPFLELTALDPSDLLELRRRVAENKFRLAYHGGRPIQEIEAQYKQICKLGFSELDIKSTFTIMFARYCLRHGRKQQGMEYLKRLRRELTNHVKLYQHLKDEVDAVLAEEEATFRDYPR